MFTVFAEDACLSCLFVPVYWLTDLVAAPTAKKFWKRRSQVDPAGILLCQFFETLKGANFSPLYTAKMCSKITSVAKVTKGAMVSAWKCTKSVWRPGSARACIRIGVGTRQGKKTREKDWRGGAGLSDEPGEAGDKRMEGKDREERNGKERRQGRDKGKEG